MKKTIIKLTLMISVIASMMPVTTIRAEVIKLPDLPLCTYDEFGNAENEPCARIDIQPLRDENYDF